MSECKYPSCHRVRGTQDRDDYRRAFCSVQCEVKYDHLKDDARDARRSVERDAQPEPGREP